MNLPFVDSIKRADRDNAIDMCIWEMITWMCWLTEDGKRPSRQKPPVFTAEEKEPGWTP